MIISQVQAIIFVAVEIMRGSLCRSIRQLYCPKKTQWSRHATGWPSVQVHRCLVQSWVCCSLLYMASSMHHVLL